MRKHLLFVLALVATFGHAIRKGARHDSAKALEPMKFSETETHIGNPLSHIDINEFAHLKFPPWKPESCKKDYECPRDYCGRMANPNKLVCCPEKKFYKTHWGVWEYCGGLEDSLQGEEQSKSLCRYGEQCLSGTCLGGYCRDFDNQRWANQQKKDDAAEKVREERKKRDIEDEARKKEFERKQKNKRDQLALVGSCNDAAKELWKKLDQLSTDRETAEKQTKRELAEYKKQMMESASQAAKLNLAAYGAEAAGATLGAIPLAGGGLQATAKVAEVTLKACRDNAVSEAAEQHVKRMDGQFRELKQQIKSLDATVKAGLEATIAKLDQDSFERDMAENTVIVLLIRREITAYSTRVFSYADVTAAGFDEVIFDVQKTYKKCIELVVQYQKFIEGLWSSDKTNKKCIGKAVFAQGYARTQMLEMKTQMDAAYGDFKSQLTRLQLFQDARRRSDSKSPNLDCHTRAFVPKCGDIDNKTVCVGSCTDRQGLTSSFSNQHYTCKWDDDSTSEQRCFSGAHNGAEQLCTAKAHGVSSCMNRKPKMYHVFRG